MPINIPDNLPSKEILEKENIFVMTTHRAVHQDIRPLKIVILNIMPTKIVTETQLLRLIGNTPIQVDVTLLRTDTHTSKNTSREHLENFYMTFEDIKNENFDGMIITGAPVEQLPFEEVDYWEELIQIMEWSKAHVYSTLHICWGAQAALYYHFGIPKYSITQKMFGVFTHTINKKNFSLLRGFDDEFFVPHSRHTEIRKIDIEKVCGLDILSESEESGVCIVKTRGGRQIFVTGHLEYDADTLKTEFERDVAKGLTIETPRNYFPYDDPQRDPIVKWRSHANLLFSNWLNYYVYQETPYDLHELK